MKIKKRAFSLVEILIGLITISIIIAAFAPVFTKKVSTTAGFGSGKTGKDFPYNPLDPNCREVVAGSLDCDFKMPPNVSRISAIVISGGGGGGGATAGTRLENQTKEATSGYVDIPITKEMKNVVISNLAGAGGGGGGGAYYSAGDANAPSIAFCSKVGALFVPASYNGTGGKDLCVMKKDLCYGVYNSEYGVYEPGPCASTHGNGGYSWNSAYSYCKSYRPTGTKKGDWRPPTLNEMAGWANIINNETKSAPKLQKWLYANGLNLCETMRSNASIYGSNACPGNNGDRYGLYNAIEKTGSGSYVGKTYYLMSGNFKAMTDDNGNMRCVYAGSVDSSGNVSSTPASYSSAGGGAGSSGAQVSALPIDDEIISAAIGGKIRLTVGSGGSAGAKGASNGASGGAGGTGGASNIAIYNSIGSIIYQIAVSGGNGGQGATKTTAGTGGAVSNTCRKAQNGTTSTISCSPLATAGFAGAANLNKTSSITSSGGAASGLNYGLGGAGGSATGTNANAGSVGSNGYAKITYTLQYEGAGGGGGGAGSLIHVDNIPVTPNKEYTVRIGSGGKGGTIGTSGGTGGESAVWFDSITISSKGATGGSAGTAQTPSAASVQGIGGEKGSIIKTGENGTVYLQKDGENGMNGTNKSTYAQGGCGAKSGTQLGQACGGLYQDIDICTNASVNGESLPFENHGNIYSDGNYGSAGSGGGGGGFSLENSFSSVGSGGKGQNGYVYLYW